MSNIFLGSSEEEIPLESSSASLKYVSLGQVVKSILMRLSSKEGLSSWACCGSVKIIFVPNLFTSFYWTSSVSHFGMMLGVQEVAGDNNKT